MSKASVGNGRSGLVLNDLDTNEHAVGLVEAPVQMIVGVTIEGVSKMLFHRYDTVSVETKGRAGKGTAQKKADDVESYVYRDGDGCLAIPAENLHACLVNSARSFQDPRSPRKSAMDLLKAGILVLPDLLPILNAKGKRIKTWDFLDTRRALVQRNAVSRTRPGLEAGWRLDADVHILLPGLVAVPFLRQIIANGGATVGLCDFRPRFGRFQVVRAEAITLK